MRNSAEWTAVLSINMMVLGIVAAKDAATNKTAIFFARVATSAAATEEASN
jgi:hypothetical protein